MCQGPARSVLALDLRAKVISLFSALASPLYEEKHISPLIHGRQLLRIPVSA